MSVAARIKFDKTSLEASKNEDTPKFVVDTGGHYGSGISLFVQLGEMVVEVGSKNSVWKVIDLGRRCNGYEQNSSYILLPLRLR